jgi:hypothetical protein
MNTTAFCKRLNLKRGTLYQYMYRGIIQRPKEMYRSSGVGRPSFEWTEKDVAKTQAIFKKRRLNLGGKRSGAGRPAKSTKAPARSSAKRNSAPAKTVARKPVHTATPAPVVGAKA